MTDYICVCHACGAWHLYDAAFLRSPLTLHFQGSDPGRVWHVQAIGCAACEDSDALAQAYQHGMSNEATARARQEFPAWEPRLLAREASESS